jgi:hypothetical protein
MGSQYVNSNVDKTFVMLAPGGARIPGHFGCVQDDVDQHSSLLSQMQRLRGAVYLQDGAISKSQLDGSGRHRLPDDHQSWHLLRLREDGTVSGCARILVHGRDADYEELRVSSSALATCGTWGEALRSSMESEICKARINGRYVVEPGGWALAEDLRGSTEALSIVVGALAWAQLFGGCVGFMTATVRHGSSSILRRLGAAPVHVEGKGTSAYFDHAYGCDMELLRFDSSALNPRFGGVMEKMCKLLQGAPVIAAGTPVYESVQIAA